MKISLILLSRNFQKLCLQPSTGRSKELSKEYVEELLKYQCKSEIYHALKSWQIPKFPIDGNSLKDSGCPSGKVLGVVMNKLREIWVEEEFKTTKEDLMKHLPKIFNDLNIVDGKLVKKVKTN